MEKGRVGLLLVCMGLVRRKARPAGADRVRRSRTSGIRRAPPWAPAWN